MFFGLNTHVPIIKARYVSCEIKSGLFYYVRVNHFRDRVFAWVVLDRTFVSGVSL